MYIITIHVHVHVLHCTYTHIHTCTCSTFTCTCTYIHVVLLIIIMFHLLSRKLILNSYQLPKHNSPLPLPPLPPLPPLLYLPLPFLSIVQIPPWYSSQPHFHLPRYLFFIIPYMGVMPVEVMLKYVSVIIISKV